METEKPDLIITNLKKTPAMKGCIIYAWHRGDECLYIGSTSDLRGRLRSHHLINKLTFLEGDWIEVYRIDITKERLRKFEESIIKLVAPTYNINHAHLEVEPYSSERICPNCAKAFSAITTWQKFCSNKCRNVWHSRQRSEKIPTSLRRSQKPEKSSVVNKKKLDNEFD